MTEKRKTHRAPTIVNAQRTSSQPGGDNEVSPLAFTAYSRLSPAITTEVFDAYWRFAAERQMIFFRRIDGMPNPWTDDPILQQYKFTNVYRASDRVSQYLISRVIYHGDQAIDEIFFRIVLFKIFNRITTWEMLERRLGTISFADYSYDRYDAALTDMLASGSPIFSAAYIMPSGTSVYGFRRKHQNYLRLIERLMGDEVPKRIAGVRRMREGFELLRSYPMIGDFLAYQYIIDINYSNMTMFSENEFVMPGPGAKDGIHKCFDGLGGLSEADIIRLMADRQEEEFARLGIRFLSLWGRRLQLIDCQNLFCEVGKYARLAHPHVKGLSGRIRIKQKYRIQPNQSKYWYPPKWKINHRIEAGGLYDSLR